MNCTYCWIVVAAVVVGGIVVVVVEDAVPGVTVVAVVGSGDVVVKVLNFVICIRFQLMLTLIHISLLEYVCSFTYSGNGS